MKKMKGINVGYSPSVESIYIIVRMHPHVPKGYRSRGDASVVCAAARNEVKDN